MQIQIVMKYHCTPTGVATVLKSLTLPSAGVDTQALVPLYILTGLPNITATVENSLEFSYKVNHIQLLYAWVNKNLGLPKKLYTNFYSSFTCNSPAQMTFNW